MPLPSPLLVSLKDNWNLSGLKGAVLTINLLANSNLLHCSTVLGTVVSLFLGVLLVGVCSVLIYEIHHETSVIFAVYFFTGDLLNNYCKMDPVANATRFFFACVVTLTYPIECFVAREV